MESSQKNQIKFAGLKYDVKSSSKAKQEIIDQEALKVIKMFSPHVKAFLLLASKTEEEVIDLLSKVIAIDEFEKTKGFPLFPER